ncbi:MAG: Smr/MutS family protein [Acidobacteria bacterium]|nr:Smr/MutS family protein [Acidobacteriota bacterium]
MHDGSLRALEFDRIVEAVRSLALTPLGAAALGDLAPQSDARAVRTALAATTEGVDFLESHDLPLAGPADLEESLGALAIEGRLLEPRQLRGLATFLASVDAVRAAVRQADAEAFPALRTLVEGCRSFEREGAEILATIDEQGEVVDRASPELRAIRERLRKQRQRLRNTLASFLRGRDTARYLQEQVVTERDGRFVLLVRSEHRGSIPGIVHGSSGSGASLFLEPLSTVEINNDIVALEQDESNEIRRILLALANGLRRRGLDLRRTVSAAAELDVIQARARFSRLVDGVEPALAPDSRIELPAARHPLLIPAVRARAGNGNETSPNAGEAAGPVPVDIELAPPTGALVVTGPNTGGKTVALKTTGLLILMAQAGLHVPAAAGARVGVFQSVFADIGDDQSIANSLSTFSGHIAHIVEMEERLLLPALVLLDEVGAGTDPTEGGALGAAIIERFRCRGALVAATTHDDLLKSYASTTEGVTCAGFGFDPDTYAPTYRLAYGVPGRSLAFEIASRLGLPEAVIEDARDRRSAREAQLAEHLERTARTLAELEAARAEVEAERKRLSAEDSRLAAAHREVDERQAELRKQLKQGVAAEVGAARREVETIVAGLRARAADLARQGGRRSPGRPRLSTGDTGGLKREVTDALAAVAERRGRGPGPGAGAPAAEPPPAPPTPPAAPPGVGNRVAVESLGMEGRVMAIHGRKAEVEVRGKRLRVGFADIRILADAPPAATGGGVTLDVRGADDTPAELNVIGCRVDEALSRVDKYLDQAIVSEQRQVRVIHGHGTGQLRKAIAGLLDGHPMVSTFAAAAPEHGGGGVTVIELRDTDEGGNPPG